MSLPRTAAARLLGALCLITAGLPAACITERLPSPNARGVLVTPGGRASDLPPRPIASSNPSATTSAQARFAVAPLGVVHYDGLTLPLISPDGKRLASQINRPPGWPGILATPGEHRADLCRVSIYTLGDGNAAVSDASEAIPRGVVLGRFADQAGFFVEAPQPDDSRWIGRCDWTTGAVTWLVQEKGVCAAHAIALRDGTLVYTARTGDTLAALIIAAPGRPPVRLALPNATFMFPLATPAQNYLAAIVLSPESMDLVFVDLRAPDGPRLGASCTLATGPSPQSAFQAVAAAQAVMPLKGADQWGELADSVIVFAPRFAGAVVVSAHGANITRLPRRSLSAVPVVSASVRGMLVATEQDVRFSEFPRDSQAPIPSGARVLTEPFICRALEGEENAFAAIGNRQTSAEPALVLVRLSTVK